MYISFGTRVLYDVPVYPIHRATRGLAITNFHGNFFVRSTDLLSLPNINPDAGFGMQVNIEEPLHNIRTACFQAALLYTSSRGKGGQWWNRLRGGVGRRVEVRWVLYNLMVIRSITQVW